MDDDDYSVEAFVLASDWEAIVADHSVEEGTGRRDEVNVANGVFLEQDLEDWYHDNDITYCEGDESHHAEDHF